jgi:hypothetical protein
MESGDLASVADLQRLGCSYVEIRVTSPCSVVFSSAVAVREAPRKPGLCRSLTLACEIAGVPNSI